MSPRGPKKGSKRQSHSDEKKESVLAELRSGKTVKEVSESTGVSAATINFWKKLAGLTGGKRGRRPGSTVSRESRPTASRVSAKSIDGAITLNGEVYVPASTIDMRANEKMMKVLGRLEAELSDLKSLVTEAA
jgi:transposase-like protein